MGVMVGDGNVARSPELHAEESRRCRKCLDRRPGSNFLPWLCWIAAAPSAKPNATYLLAMWDLREAGNRSRRQLVPRAAGAVT
jgi:hypothetical protein